MSTLANIDFQALLHQEISQIMGSWGEKGLPQDVCQDYAGQLFNMGMIAAQQLVQAPQIQIENMPDPIDVGPELAEHVVKSFVWGLQEAYSKAFQLGIPKQESLELIQTVAMFIFEQAKQICVASQGQVAAGQGPIEDEQIRQWLGQTTGEAFQHYLGEMEKERGPLMGKAHDDAGAALLQQPAPEPAPMTGPEMDPMPAPVGMEDENPHAMQQPEAHAEQVVPSHLAQQPQPVAAGPVADTQTVALGLILSALQPGQQQEIKQLFPSVDWALASQFQQLAQVPPSIDSVQLVQTIRELKQQIKQVRQRQPKGQLYFRKRFAKLIAQLPPNQVAKLFVKERVLLQDVMDEFLSSVHHKQPLPKRTLPEGLWQSIEQYVRRQFPNSSSGAH